MSSLPIPREHGAYVVLAASWLLGILWQPSVEPAGAALSFTVIATLFLAQQSLRQIVGRRRGRAERITAWRWLIGLCIAGAAAFSLLAWLHPAVLWIVPPALVLSSLLLLLDQRRYAMTDLSLAGFPALALAAPLAYISVADVWTGPEALSLWALATAFFCGSVYCVNIRLRGRSAMAPAVWFHAIILAVTAALVTMHALPVTALLVMLLAAGRLAWVLGNVERYRRLPLKQIGIQETAAALLFVVIAAAR